jgi:hypothetical protein
MPDLAFARFAGQIQSLEELEETGAILMTGKPFACFIVAIRDMPFGYNSGLRATQSQSLQKLLYCCQPILFYA